jgi:hypothetical protein
LILRRPIEPIRRGTVASEEIMPCHNLPGHLISG